LEGKEKEKEKKKKRKENHFSSLVSLPMKDW